MPSSRTCGAGRFTWFAIRTGWRANSSTRSACRRTPEIEKPDYLLIDLDPTTDGQWPYVREIALVVRDVMEELGLGAYPKTSGATGLHVIAPIKPELPFPEVRRFAKALAEEVERRVGDQEVA